MLAYVCPPLPVPGLRENLHTAADIGVLAAVAVGAIALGVQLYEGWGRRAAVNARIRTGALGAHRRLRQVLDANADVAPTVGQRVAILLSQVIGGLADQVKELADAAPEASRALDRAASKAHEAFWNAVTMAEREQRFLGLGGSLRDEVAQKVLDEFERCATLLRQAAGPELLP